MRKLLVAGAVLAAACVAAPQFSHAAPNANVLATAKSAVAPSASVQKVAWVWVGGRRIWRPVVVVRPGPVVVARPGVVVGAAPYTWGGRPYWHRRWWNGGWRYY